MSDEWVDRCVLNHVEVWPHLPYPYGVSALWEYPKGRGVLHLVPRGGELDALYDPIVKAHYARTWA